jgi:hypothetical protein
MGKGTRKAELQQRRHRQMKRRKQRRNQLLKQLKEAKTRDERLRLVRELKASEQPTSVSVAKS